MILILLDSTSVANFWFLGQEFKYTTLQTPPAVIHKANFQDKINITELATLIGHEYILPLLLMNTSL